MVGTLGLVPSDLPQNNTWTGPFPNDSQPQNRLSNTARNFPPNMASYLNYSAQSDPRMTFGGLLDIDQCNVAGSYGATGNETQARFLDFDITNIVGNTFRKPPWNKSNANVSAVQVAVKSKAAASRLESVSKKDGSATYKETPSPMSVDSNASSPGLAHSSGVSSDGGDRDSSESVSGASKPKRHRTKFSQHQTQELDRVFDRCRYPNLPMREQIAKSIGLSESRIQVWFQNRRAKLKRAGKVNLKAYIVPKPREATPVSNPAPAVVNQRQWKPTGSPHQSVDPRNNMYRHFPPSYPMDLVGQYGDMMYQPMPRSQILTGNTQPPPYEDFRFRPGPTPNVDLNAIGRLPCPNVTFPYV